MEKIQKATDLLGQAAQVLRDYAVENAAQAETAQFAHDALSRAKDIEERREQMTHFMKRVQGGGR